MRYASMLLSTAFVTAVALVLGGCGGSGAIDSQALRPAPAEASLELGFPAALPVDQLQPWETLRPEGYVISPARGASCINADSTLCCGVERDAASLVGVSDNGEAARFVSGDAGAGGLSWAYWRLTMGGEQPGAVSADVNLRPMSDGGRSAYYLGLSDYGAGRWQWHGPLSDSQTRLSLPAGNYLSELGNLFVCIAAAGGATFDVVGVAANCCDAGDGEAPAAPAGLTATAVAGGLELSWDEVSATDLAGYRVYHAASSFLDAHTTGVKVMPTLEGLTHYALPAAAETYVRVSAIDISGNESPLSDIANATPLAGAWPDVRLTASQPSGLVGEAITLTASGADEYDWDLDGDGFFELSGDVTGEQDVDTGRPGFIRPAVRGLIGDGSCRACGGVSVLIGTNSRPVADGHADPSAGNAPLSVTFSGTGTDDDGTIAQYSWDFEDDGTYDYSHATEPDPPLHVFETPGLYNAKFRVEDDLGSWDVDTVAVSVSDPLNVPPVAELAIGAGEEAGDTPHTVNFDAGGSTDSDGSILYYWWDFDGDGDYDEWSTGATIQHTYTAGGLFNATVCVVDDGFAQDTASVAIDVNATPVADIQADVTSGDCPLAVSFDASGSSDSDGTLEDYEWDLDGDATFNETGPEEDARGSDSASYTYSAHGEHTATLRVTDDDGATATDSTSVVVGNAAPVAALSAGAGEQAGDTPHTVNFDASGSTDADGDIVEYVWDFDGDGDYDAWSADATSTHIYTTGALFTAEVRVTDDLGAQDAATLQIDVNATPVAQLAADPLRGAPPLSVDFDASGSSDGDGALEDYEWDLDGDGIFNETGDEADAQGEDSASYTYSSIGGCTPAVRITDNDGASDTDSVQVKALGWSVVTVDSDGSVGQSTSLAVVDGCPAISYCDLSNFDLKYARATTSTGASADDWTQIVTVDSPGTLVRDYGTSLAVVDGCPAISYCDDTNSDLKYARATTSTGASAGDWVKVIVDSSDYAGRYSSLAVVDGCPAISYRKWSSGGQLKYARATTSTGGSAADWTQIVTVDTGDGIKETSLCVVSGCPAISYYDLTGLDLKYARATTATGGSAGDWTQIVTVDSSGDVGRYSSLAVIDGYPAISYCLMWVTDTTRPDNLKFASSTTSTGASAADWQSWTVDSAGDTGGFTSLAEIDGQVAISYFDLSNYDVKYYSGHESFTADSTGQVGEFTSLAEVSGGLAISYYDSTNSDLKYAYGVF